MTVDPLANHRASAAEVLPDGDAVAIKQLYVDLGRDWWEAHAGEPETIPVLSAAETCPVVVARLADSAGLVLDAGCGPNPAVSLALAASPRRNVVSLDMGWGTVRLAQQLAERQGRRLFGVVGDVERLPFRDGAFAAVACLDCLEHLPDDAAAIVELARVAGARGRVVIATPNRTSAAVLRRKLRDRSRGVRRPDAEYYVSNSHIREYTWRELEELVAPALSVVHRVPVGWTRSWKSRLATRLLTVRPLHRLSQMIVVEAEPR